MLFPCGTNAPVYYRPFATGAFIAINVTMFLMTGMGDYHSYRWLILEFDRINPLQWVTAAFMHASWVHLVCNMIFLWCFGLVVEGKIGWRRFSLLYLGLALADGAIGQIPMFFFSNSTPFLTELVPGALGASGVIFALIAVAMVWAPENEMKCLFFWSFWFVRSVEVPIFGLAAFYLAMELLEVALIGFSMSSAMLHLLGMLVGFPFAIVMLRRGLVDCQGYDWFSRHPSITRRLTSWCPLSMFGGMLFGTPARERARLELGKHSNQSGRDALALIQQNPAKFNPKPAALRRQPAPAGHSTDMISPASDTWPAVKLAKRAPQAKRAKVQPKSPSLAAVDEVARRTASKLVEAIESGDVLAAKQWFANAMRHSRSDSLPSKLIGHYCNLLSRHGEHLASIEPLEILVDRGTKHANQACLQLALIHWQLRQDNHAARLILSRMNLAELSSAGSRELARRRRRLLARIDSRGQLEAQGTATPRHGI